MQRLFFQCQLAATMGLSPGDHGTLTLSDYAGKNLVLYFYPKDSTPGCTTEALDFTANKAAFSALKTEIIGVSRDSLKKHDNFIAKKGLKIVLGADLDGKVTGGPANGRPESKGLARTPHAKRLARAKKYRLGAKKLT